MAAKKAKRKPGGRPTKYTPERVAKIIHALKLGNYRCVAANYAGITYETFNEWMKAKVEFSEQVIAAETEAEVLVVGKLRSNDDWRANMEWLARRNPERWSKQEKHQVTGAEGAPLTIVYQVVTKEGDDA